MPEKVEFSKVFQEEQHEIRKRRSQVGLNCRATADADAGADAGAANQRGAGHPASDHPERCTPTVGLALSGGGIRSASFNLGVIQSLYRRGVLRHVDYLSTVSGGGYAGSYLSSTVVSGTDNIDWRAADANGEGQRLPLEIGDDGRQPDAIRSLLNKGKSLNRPLVFFSRWFCGFLLVNTFFFSGLFVLVSLAAILFHVVSDREAIILVQQLGFRGDFSRAFFPAVCLFGVWLFAQALRGTLKMFFDRVPDFPTAIFAAFVVTVAMAILALFATGDISLRPLETDWGFSKKSVELLKSLINQLGSVLLLLVSVLLLPLLNPKALIRSGTNPQSLMEKWAFRAISFAVLCGVPGVVFWFLAQENISGYNEERLDKYTFGEKQIDDGKKFWREVLADVADSRNAANAMEPNAGSNSGNPGGGGEGGLKPKNSPSPQILSSADPSRLPGFFPENSTKPQQLSNEYVVEKFISLQQEVEHHDHHAWLIGRWARFAFYLLGTGEQFPDRLADRRRLWDWQRALHESVSDKCLSDPTFYRHFPKPVQGSQSSDSTVGTRQGGSSNGPFANDGSGGGTTEYHVPKWFADALHIGQTDGRYGYDDLYNEAIKQENLTASLITQLKDRQNGLENPAAQPGQGEVSLNPGWLLAKVRSLRKRREDLVQSQRLIDRSDLTAYQAELSKVEGELNDATELLTDVRKVNWALLESYYSPLGVEIREPSRIFAVTVTAADQQTRARILLTSLVLFLIVGTFISVNPTSLHGFYRSRLRETWVAKHPEYGQRIPLSEMDTCRRGAPYQLFNGALNLFGRREDRLRDTKTLFMFSHRFCGANRIGYAATEGYLKRHNDIANAMAVSGAAVTPTQVDNLLVRMILVLLNLRLGLWMPNPSHQPSDIAWPSPLRLLLGYLYFRPDERSYCFVSDGGHNENTGIAALLQRRCRVIIASDASQDELYRFLDIHLLVQEGETQHGVKFRSLRHSPEAGANDELDLSSLVPASIRRSSGSSGEEQPPWADRHFEVFRIEYPDDEVSRLAGLRSKADRTGFLIYLKPTLTGDEPLPVREYQRSNKHFPHDPTSDQDFVSQKFQAYITLGNHVGQDVCEQLFGYSSLLTTESDTEPDAVPWLAERWKPLEMSADELLAGRPIDEDAYGLLHTMLQNGAADCQEIACNYLVEQLIEQGAELPAEFRSKLARDLDHAFRETRDIIILSKISRLLQKLELAKVAESLAREEQADEASAQAE